MDLNLNKMHQTKTYNKLKPEIILLIDQLIVNKELNENALQKINDELAKEKVKSLLAKKKIYIQEVANVMEIDMRKYNTEQRQNIDIILQKVSNQFQDLFYKGNDIQLIAFLISAENKLQSIYHNLIYHSRFDDFVLMIFKNQLVESQRDMLELNKIHAEYI
jgi:hypothetical protein